MVIAPYHARPIFPRDPPWSSAFRESLYSALARGDSRPKSAIFESGEAEDAQREENSCLHCVSWLGRDGTSKCTVYSASILQEICNGIGFIAERWAKALKIQSGHRCYRITDSTRKEFLIYIDQQSSHFKRIALKFSRNQFTSPRVRINVKENNT